MAVEDGEEEDNVVELRQPNPRMQFRLPREDDLEFIYDERPPLMITAKAILGPRFQEKRGRGFFLDGRPASTDKIMAAANLKYKDAA